MPYATELNGPMAFERQQGLHDVLVVEGPLPGPKIGSIRILRREVQYPFLVQPSITAADNLMRNLDERGVLTLPNVTVQTSPSSRWRSRFRLPVFMAHGGRDIHRRHIVGWQGKIADSQSVFRSINVWCSLNGVPRPQVFISCDQRVGVITTRWDQSSRYPVIGFSGGDNWISTEPNTNTLILHLDKMRQEHIGPNPFSSGSNPNRGLIDDLFWLQIDRPK